MVRNDRLLKIKYLYCTVCEKSIYNIKIEKNIRNATISIIINCPNIENGFVLEFSEEGFYDFALSLMKNYNIIDENLVKCKYKKEKLEQRNAEELDPHLINLGA